MDSYFVIKLRLKKLLSYSVIFISLLILNLLPTSDFRYKFLTRVLITQLLRNGLGFITLFISMFISFQALFQMESSAL